MHIIPSLCRDVARQRAVWSEDAHQTTFGAMLQNHRYIYASRARRKSREIMLAVVLTLAAAAFAIAAIQRQATETTAVVIDPNGNTPLSN